MFAALGQRVCRSQLGKLSLQLPRIRQPHGCVFFLRPPSAPPARKSCDVSLGFPVSVAPRRGICFIGFPVSMAFWRENPQGKRQPLDVEPPALDVLYVLRRRTCSRPHGPPWRRSDLMHADKKLRIFGGDSQRFLRETKQGYRGQGWYGRIPPKSTLAQFDVGNGKAEGIPPYPRSL